MGFRALMGFGVWGFSTCTRTSLGEVLGFEVEHTFGSLDSQLSGPNTRLKLNPKLLNPTRKDERDGGSGRGRDSSNPLNPKLKIQMI